MTARKLAVLLRDYGRHLNERYGWTLPPDLAALADTLPGGQRDAERDVLARRRALSAARSRRYRAKRRRAAASAAQAGDGPREAISA